VTGGAGNHRPHDFTGCSGGSSGELSHCVLDQIRQWLSSYPSLSSPLGIVLALCVPVLSVAAGFVVILALPAEYFVRPPSTIGLWRSHKVLRISGLVAKNLVGWLLFLVGIVLALPLVPGPGALFMLIGLGLVDFPGKRALQRRLLRQRHVLHSVNRIRARFERPPLLTGEEPTATQRGS
jgi:hypothetical protein